MSIVDYELYERDEPALSGVERELFDAVSADEPWALVERFAELERVSGSEDEVRAAEYLLERLDALGLDHRRHDPELRLSIPESASLAVDGEPFDAVKTVAFSGTGAVASHAVVAGNASVDGGIDDLLTADIPDSLHVAGRVVVLGGILPIEAIQEAEDRGAAAVIVVHPHEREPHEGIATPVWGGVPDPDGGRRSPEIPVVVAARPVADALTDGAPVEVSAETRNGWVDCPLVEARIEGGADPTDDFVLLHGHYDSWHIGVADNATGDAALLEAARVLDAHSDDLSRNLRVAWWPGHSTGRYAGSTRYADEFAHEIRDHCVAHVNCDSPGAVDATEFEDMLCWMPEADALCQDAIADVCGKTAAEVRPPRAGDYSFSNLGVSGAFMLSSNIPMEVREARGYHPVGGCGGHADAWHLTTDTLDKADPDVLVRDIRVYAVTVFRLLRTDVVPLNFTHTVDRHLEQLREYHEASAFDLEPVLDELDALGDAVAAFHDAVDDGEVAPELANETVKELQRRLVRLGFCEDGPFEQDPAIGRPPYPALKPATALPDEDDARRCRLVHLKRARNAVLEDLRDARATVELAIVRE